MYKQKQNVGDQSTALQAQGNMEVTIINNDYENIRSIFTDLLELNFPRIKEEAQEIADKRFSVFLEILKRSVENNKDDIDSTKFSDPGIQYEMQQIAIDVVRRGDKSNMELLSELLCTVTSADCPELIELVAGETLRILPMLSKKHLAYLSFEILFNEATMLDPSLEKIDASLEKSLGHLDGLADITSSDLSYLVSNGCISFRGIRPDEVVPQLVKSIKKYEHIKLPALKIIVQQQGLSNIENFIALSEKLIMGNCYVNAYGRLIGWLNFGKYSGADIKQLFA